MSVSKLVIYKNPPVFDIVDETIIWTKEAAKYLSRLDADAVVGVHVLGRLPATGEAFAASDTVEIDKPDLDITVSIHPVLINVLYQLVKK